MKRIAVLGSTGSIGTSTLRVVDAHPGRFRVAVLAAGRNLDRLEEQARAYRPECIVTADEDGAREIASRVDDDTRVLHGLEGLEAAARWDDVDTVVSGVVGALGLRPTYAAIDAGRVVAIANKESLVVGGAFLTARARETGAVILPVDSEHNALHQCLRGESMDEVRTLWLTASGGPFRTTPADKLSEVGPDEALRHPTWSMGPKITVDSATLMNKGLEVIEARWLFDVGADRIRVVVHPGSVVHSMVEFRDGSFKAQLGVTDMRHPIQYALTWPERLPSDLPGFDPITTGSLEFEAPDTDRFPCLDLAFRALREGGVAPAVLNAANEVAVQAFLDRRIRFLDIPAVVGEALETHGAARCGTLDDVLAADAMARATAIRRVGPGAHR